MIDQAAIPSMPGSAAMPMGADWHPLATRVLAGHVLEFGEALAVLQSDDDGLLDLLSAAYRIRRHYFANRVQLYFLMNAKSGLCPEDCGYCSPVEGLRGRDSALQPAQRRETAGRRRVAAERQAKTFCIVISARGPSQREMEAVTRIVPQIKSQFNLKVCACLGLLDARASPAAQGLRRRPGEPQSQHQRGPLRRDLLDPQLSGSRGHVASRSQCRHGALLAAES